MTIVHTCACCGAPLKVCPVCGKSFAAAAKHSATRYCSQSCFFAYRRSSLVARFWKNLPDRPDDGCWLWRGSVRGSYGVIGRGSLKFGGTQIGAHRLSYELAHGAIPDGLIVRHTCDVRLCCNPAHLILGTTADNVRDRVERGRSNNWSAPRKLTDEQVAEVRAMLADGVQGKDIAAHFHVSVGLISVIKHGKHRP